MGRLVVVSNRVAPFEPGKAPSGGLAVAMLAVLRQSGGIWFGWSGEIAPNGSEPSPRPRLRRAGRLIYATLDLSRRDFDEYYNGYANSTLWPIFHHRLDLAAFSRRTEEAYQRVNRLFAAALLPLIRPDDVVWVQDYHLIPLGEELRRLGAAQRIGFFLHTPFPVPEILAPLPWRDGLIRALAAYDVVGFQTARDRDAFLANLPPTARVGDGVVAIDGHRLEVDAFPISVETADIEREAKRARYSKQTRRLVDSLVGRDLIVGVDRLDYSKGLPQRFDAFRTLLEAHPARQGHVTFMQIAPPTRIEVREYRDIRHLLEMRAGAVNGAFADFDWVPIRYLNKSFTQRQLLGFYRAARVGLVTPLRDGMNLVAKEYVAAQDPQDPGVLVLSRFAGAAAELEAAVLVNPYDIESVADALELALAMPPPERRARHEALMAVLRAHDIGHWRDRFLAALDDAPRLR